MAGQRRVKFAPVTWEPSRIFDVEPRGVLTLAAAATTDKPNPAAKQPTVLVVEDEILIRLMIAEELRSCGFAVIEAADADEAETVLQSTVSIDLMFTDVRMPGSMDGAALADRARSLRPDVKIVVTSGQAPEWASSRSIDAFFRKPYDVEQVIERIRDLMARGEAEEAGGRNGS
jgi:two-component system, response regulator PdtaR